MHSVAYHGEVWTDGSGFAWQHWSHTFEYALASGPGDWRAAGFVALAEDYNHELLALSSGGTTPLGPPVTGGLPAPPYPPGPPGPPDRGERLHSHYESAKHGAGTLPMRVPA